MRDVEIINQENEKLTTKERVRNYLGIDNYDYDDLLDGLIQSASDYFRNKTGYLWNKAQLKETLDGQGRNSIILSQKPVQSIESLEISGTPTEDYYLYKGAGIVKKKNGVFIAGMANIVVVYNCGYDNVPADIKQACTELVGQYFQDKDYQGISQYSIGDESISFEETELPRNVKEILDSNQKIKL